MSCCVPGCLNTCRVNKDISYHIFPHPDKEAHRHNEWLKAINNSKLALKSSKTIYKQFRVCRKHFDKDCFNGACKRLLSTAIPTLHMNHKKKKKIKVSMEKSDNLDSNMLFNDEYYNLSNKSINMIPSKDFDSENVFHSNINCESNNDNNVTNYDLNIDQFEEDSYPISCYTISNDLKQNTNSSSDEYDESNDQYEVVEIIDSSYSKAPLTDDILQTWRKDFYKDSKNRLAQNICSRVDPFDVCISRKALEKTQHVFNYKIDNEGKPLTNQKSSGRCWIFAALNVIRVPFMKHHKLEEFEFSQGFLFYWDKIERCHYFLNNIVEASQRGEDISGRLLSFLLTDPTCDGGQWDMFCNLINKHGVMPKKCFPESFSCESSVHMNAILKSKLREYAKIIHELVISSRSEDEVKKTIQKQMSEIYSIVGICLGIPPESFEWEYYTEKNKEYNRTGPISSVEFYEKLVKPYFDINNKVCLVTDPRPTNPYNKVYTVDCLGNMIGGRPVLYNNQSVEMLMDLVKESLKSGEPVWFGCEVSKRFAGKLGIEDLEIHDFKLVFNVDIQVTMSKADRLLYGESAMTHAMCFTAVSVDENDKPTKFRVENSWGEDRGEKGYLIMSADWFKEFVFEIVVDKSLVPADVLKVFDMTPIVLPAWDCMGNLAK